MDCTDQLKSIALGLNSPVDWRPHFDLNCKQNTGKSGQAKSSRRRKRNPTSEEEEEEEEEEEDDDDIVCGLGSYCSPGWLQPLASKQMFLAIFCLACVLQGMFYAYFVSVLTTIEKLFQIQSKTTGIISQFRSHYPINTTQRAGLYMTLINSIIWLPRI